LPSGEAIDAARRARGGAGGDVHRAPEHRLDASEQLAQVERLGDVVVGADLEADHLVDRVAAAGDEHQAALPVLAQLPGNREAILAGQAEVEQHELRRIGGHQAEQLGAAVRLRNAKALTLQIVREQRRDLCLVVEDRDVDGGAHRSEGAGLGVVSTRATEYQQSASARDHRDGAVPARYGVRG